MAVAGEIANLIVALKLDDSGFTGKINRVAGTLNRMDAGLARTTRGVGQVGSGLSRLATVGALAAAGGLGAVVTTAVSFEDAFAGVRKTVDATDEELDRLQETFREMAREIPLSFESFAALGEQAGALGIAAADIDEFTRVAALLGVTTDVAADQAATSLGVLSNVLHLTGEDYDNFGATLVDLGNKGASTESSILAIAERAGAGAALIGIASDATLGWSSSIANLGIEVEAGGTALQKFFLESLRNIQDDKTLQLMAETAGTTGAAFKKAFEEDASTALQTFVVGLGKLENAERLAVLEALGFSDIRITRALLGLAGDTDKLTASLDTAEQAWRANTALTEEAEKRFRTTASQIQKLKNNLRDVAFTIGAELLPVTNELINDFVKELDKPGTQAGIKAFAQDLAAGVRGLVGELRGTDFSGLLSGMKFAADAAKLAFDAFRSLPAPLQTAIVGLVALNKVSGGGIGLLAKGLANIAFGGLQAGIGGLFGGRGSSPANPMWVQMVGGVPGGGVPPVGGGGGGLVGGLKTGAALAAPLLVGVAAVEVINFENMREEQKAGLQGILDEMPRGPEDIQASIKKLEGEINAERPILEGVLFNTNVRPQLEKELSELQNLKRSQDQVRAHVTRELSLLNSKQSNTISKLSDVASRVNEARAATDRGFGNQAGYLSTISRKNFSPNVNVVAKISNTVVVNANRVLSAVTEARVRTGTIPEFA